MIDRLDRYRPTKTADGEGGYTETLSDAAGLDGGIEVHENELYLSYRTGEDVAIGDVISAGGAYYRVMQLIGPLRGMWTRALLERRDRPITP